MRARRAPALTESEAHFGSWLEELLTLYRWRWTHFLPAQLPNGRHVTALSGDAGFPDYVAVRPPRCVFMEIKREGGRPSQAQREWLADLEGCPSIEVYVYRPSDRDEIERVLR